MENSLCAEGLGKESGIHPDIDIRSTAGNRIFSMKPFRFIGIPFPNSF